MNAYRRLELLECGPRTIIRPLSCRLVQRDEIEGLARQWNYVADLTECQTLVIDCSNLEVMSTVMLSKLVLLQQRLEERGAELVLRGIHEGIRGVLNWTQLDRLFAIQEDDQEEVAVVA